MCWQDKFRYQCLINIAHSKQWPKLSYCDETTLWISWFSHFPFLSFIEWVEFSPYEVGMAKYGTFAKTEQFGNKFFCGKLVRSYKEPPIHYLEGKILNATAPLQTGLKPWWGSLCCVLGQGNLVSKSLLELGVSIKTYSAPASSPWRRNQVKVRR